MKNIAEIITAKRSKYDVPGDDELRKLPYGTAFIYGRVSSPEQVRDSRESIGQIADLVELAKDDGYETGLTGVEVEQRLVKIQKGEAQADTWADGEVVVDVRDLGISGTISGEQRTGMQHLLSRLETGEVGAIYITEGMSRISRDKDKVEPYSILRLIKKQDCRVRTPEEVRNPRINRDWQSLEDEIIQAVGEGTVRDRRLIQRKQRKASRGEYVGEPIVAGYIIPITNTAPNGKYIYGKLQPYEPHALITEKVIREYVRQNGSTTNTLTALNGLCYPLFPPELAYMERLSALRMAKKTASGYRISGAMIRSLAQNEKLIGYSSWGNTGPSEINHEPIIPEELFFEAYKLATDGFKPRGKGIRHEPLEWSGLLYCCNHDIPKRMSSRSAKKSYRCTVEDDLRIPRVCFDIASRYIDEPLSSAVLKQLDLTPFAEELLLSLEAESVSGNLESTQIKREITRKEQHLERLKEYLGTADKQREETYWELINQKQQELGSLQKRLAKSEKSVNPVDYAGVMEFLRVLPDKWQEYPASRRNALLKSLIEKVEIQHSDGKLLATMYWKTGLTQTITIIRKRSKGNRESHWDEPEVDNLKELWPAASWEQLHEALPGRTRKSIAHKANAMNLKRQLDQVPKAKAGRWSKAELSEAKRRYKAGESVNEVAEKVNRSEDAVRKMVRHKGWVRQIGPALEKRPIEWREENPHPKVPNEDSLKPATGGQGGHFKGLNGSIRRGLPLLESTQG